MLLRILMVCWLPVVSPIVDDRVDLIELNHVYAEDGSKQLCQMIFWEWSAYDKRLRVVDFRIIERTTRHFGPRRYRGVRYYVYLWWDVRDQVARRVRAPCFRETHTLYDPEMLDRERFPKEFRRELSPPPSRITRERKLPAVSLYSRLSTKPEESTPAVAMLHWPGHVVPCGEGAEVLLSLDDPRPRYDGDLSDASGEPFCPQRGRLHLSGVVSSWVSWRSFRDRFLPEEVREPLPWLDFGLLVGDNEDRRWWRLHAVARVGDCRDADYSQSGSQVRWPDVVLEFFELELQFSFRE